MPKEEHGLWRIYISDLELINSVDNVNSHLVLSARIRPANNPTLLDKVLSLHVQMGHASHVYSYWRLQSLLDEC